MDRLIVLTDNRHPCDGESADGGSRARAVHGGDTTRRRTEMDPKYPDVSVGLVGEDGNVFAVIGRVAKAIRWEKGEKAAAEFRSRALDQESYDAVLRLVMETVEVE